MFDFNDAPQQAMFGELIPGGTMAKVIMDIRPGGDMSSQGWLTVSKSGETKYLVCEFTVIEGPFAYRKFWQNMTVEGGKLNDQGKSVGGEITRAILRAILESARGINPSDESEQARAKRRVKGYADFDKIIFAAKIGIEKGRDGYPDRNKLMMVITPDNKYYKAIMGGMSDAGPRMPAGMPATPQWAHGPAVPPPAAPQVPETPQWVAPVAPPVQPTAMPVAAPPPDQQVAAPAPQSAPQTMQAPSQHPQQEGNVMPVPAWAQ